MVACDGTDELIADITGVPHLFGGEAHLHDDLHARLERSGLIVCSAISETRGASYALARHGGRIMFEGGLANHIGRLPASALRIDSKTAEALLRVGLARIADLISQPVPL